jgi:starch synthase
VKVPQDAYVIDFVFSEWGGDEGGVYDNRNGLDYHVPVVGSSTRQPPLDIVHIALEMAPIAKVERCFLKKDLNVFIVKAHGRSLRV